MRGIAFISGALAIMVILSSCTGKTGSPKQNKNQGQGASAESSPSSIREPELKNRLDTTKKRNEYNTKQQEEVNKENEKRSSGKSSSKQKDQSSDQKKEGQDKDQSKPESTQGGK